MIKKAAASAALALLLVLTGCGKSEAETLQPMVEAIDAGERAEGSQEKEEKESGSQNQEGSIDNGNGVASGETADNSQKKGNGTSQKGDSASQGESNALQGENNTSQKENSASQKEENASQKGDGASQKESNASQKESNVSQEKGSGQQEQFRGDVISINVGESTVVVTKIHETETEMVSYAGSGPEEEQITVRFSESTEYEVDTVRNNGINGDADVEKMAGSFSDMTERSMLQLTGSYQGEDFYASKVIIYRFIQ